MADCKLRNGSIEKCEDVITYMTEITKIIMGLPSIFGANLMPIHVIGRLAQNPNLKLSDSESAMKIEHILKSRSLLLPDGTLSDTAKNIALSAIEFKDNKPQIVNPVVE